jgi:AcrR family transcriptional regulator
MALPPRLKPRKAPKQERSRLVVDAIVEASARVLVRDGFDAMSPVRVAEVAGVSVGSLYQYFPHKEALVTAVLEREADREAAFLAARFETLAPTSVEAVVRAAIDAVLAFRADHRPLFDALLRVIPSLGRYDDLRARGARSAAALQALLAPMLKGVSIDLDEVVFVIANATHALTHEGLLPRPAGMSDARVVEEATRLVLAYLAALPR